MPARVEQHVGNRVPDLARRPQHVDVATVGEDLPGAPEHPIHGPREASDHGLEPAGQVPRAGCLDQQVHVVALHRVVDDPEARALAHLAPAPLELGEQPARSQRGHVRSGPT
jgi:hypothetical protein